MEKNIIEEIRKFVKEECYKPTSKYGSDPYELHFVPTHNYAKRMAEESGADIEVVELAAWLHDIGSIIKGRKDHHLTGVEIAEEKLKMFGYPQDQIEKIKHCILVHRGSDSLKPETLEAKIIIEADALDVFDRLAGLFEAAYRFENLSREEARISVKQKITNKWEKLSPLSRKLIKPKYEAAMLLLS